DLRRAEELGDRALDLTVAAEAHVSDALAADVATLGPGIDAVEELAGVVRDPGHDDGADDAAAVDDTPEGLELAGPEGLGHVLDLQAEAQVRLVVPEAAQRLFVRDAGVGRAGPLAVGELAEDAVEDL